MSAATTFTAWRGHGWLALAARLYLGGVFLAACWHKILDPGAFALDVATYQFLPLPLINLFALVLPWVELVAGVLLVVGLRVRAAALLIALMMVAFLIALGHALHLGLDMSCGCFASSGAEADPISWKTVLRDAGWLVLALYVLVLDRDPLGLSRLYRATKSRAKAA
jgi:putative oxidoreductase